MSLSIGGKHILEKVWISTCHLNENQENCCWSKFYFFHLWYMFTLYNTYENVDLICSYLKHLLVGMVGKLKKIIFIMALVTRFIWILNESCFWCFKINVRVFTYFLLITLSLWYLLKSMVFCVMYYFV